MRGNRGNFTGVKRRDQRVRVLSIQQPWFFRTKMRRIVVSTVLVCMLIAATVAVFYRLLQPAAALSNPTISSLSTTSGPTIGKTFTTITGTNFQNSLTFSQIATGQGHSCAVTANGKAYCWGYNAQGQLGNNSTTNSTIPVAVDTTGVLSGKTITKITVGAFHTCAVANDNKAYCWGMNNYGQLGDGTTTNRSTPVAVNTGGSSSLNGKNIQQVVAGGLYTNSDGGSVYTPFTCALTTDGIVSCWGINTSGEVGDGTTTNRSYPTLVTTAGTPMSGKTIAQIGVGGESVCAVDTNGAAYCWGGGGIGQLGNNSTLNSSVPVSVVMSGALNGKTISQLAVGRYHVCVIASDNLPYCWGNGTNGELGNNTTTSSSVPVAVTVSGVLNGKTVSQISAGGSLEYFSFSYTVRGQSCVVTTDNTFACWGYNSSGQLGDNSTTSRSVPTLVNTAGALSGKTISQISVGGIWDNSQDASNTCAVDSNGAAYCWGDGEFGANGNGSTSQILTAGTVTLPAILPTVTIGGTATAGVSYISSTQLAVVTPAHAAGAVNVVVTNPDGGTVTSTNGFTYTAPSASPNQGPTTGGTQTTVTGAGFTGGQSFVQISAGSSHSCGITANGKAYCWGGNPNGELGDNTTTSRSVPTAVYTGGVLSGKTIVQISAGGLHTCAVTTENKVYCWGFNGQGQLGDNTTTQRNAPVAVNTAGVLSGKTITQVSAGGVFFSGITTSHSCALASNGTSYCWGRNANGELGNNSTTQSKVPVAVNTAGVLSGKTLVNISAGAQHTCGLDSGGAMYCWGGNSNGELGDGTTTQRTTPVAIVTSGALNGMAIQQMDTGIWYTCAIAYDNNAYCWGYNGQGQLGDNTTVNKSVPTAVYTAGVLSGKTVTSISAGGSSNAGAGLGNTCASTADGLAYCWGYNVSGQLGDGTTTNRSTPVAVSTSGVLGGRNIVSVSAGGLYDGSVDSSQSCALTDNGQSFCWGSNKYGQIGDNTTTNRTTPTTTITSGLPNAAPSATFGGTAATDVIYLSPTKLIMKTPAKSAGAADIVITSPDGQTTTTITGGFTFVASYAGPTLSSVSPNSGSVAGGSSVTLSGTNIAETAKFTSISAGQDNAGNSGHTCGITADGRAYCWGLNGNGQLGDGTTTRSLTPIRVRGALLSKTVVQITAGGNMTCALTADNLLYCWGNGSNGKLGNNATSDSSTPVSVTQSGVLNGKTIRSVSAAGDDVCAVATDNTAACWGYNGSGRLGNNSTTASSVPVTVSGSNSFISVTPGQQTTCGIRTDYTAYCWGDNGDGAVGDNSITNRLVPTAVNTSSLLASLPMIQVGVKNAASCGLAYSGKVYCWGGGWDYGLGNGSTSQSNVPVAVSMSGLTATSLVVGFTSPCMLTTSNAVYCWGDNTYGQHGTGNTTAHTAPTQMDTTLLSGKTIAGVSTASTQTCVVTIDLVTACTGYNTDGALGNNSTSNATSLVATQNYALPSSVTFGGTAATGLTYVDQNTVTATTPAHAAGVVNVVLTRQDSNASTLTNGYTYNSAPDAPTGLATTPGNNAVILNWTAPGNNGGSAITDYFVEYSSNGGSTWNTFSHTASTSTTQTVTGLSIGTTYTFRVSATNAIGTGLPSATATGTPIYITVSASSSLALAVTPSASMRLSSNYQDASVTTNAPSGYTLGLSMSSANQNLVSGANTITPSGGTLASPTLSLTTNTWGYRVDGIGGFGTGTTTETNVSSSSYKWAGVKVSGSPDTIRSQASAISNDVTRVWYGVAADSSKPSGVYSGTVVYTAVSN